MPIGTDTSVVSVPAISEARAAWVQVMESRKYWYQRIDSDGGGKARKSDDENDIGMTMKDGAARKMTSRIASTHFSRSTSGVSSKPSSMA